MPNSGQQQASPGLQNAGDRQTVGRLRGGVGKPYTTRTSAEKSPKERELAGRKELHRESAIRVEEAKQRILLRRKKFEDLFKENWKILNRFQLETPRNKTTMSAQPNNCPDYLIVVQKTAEGCRSRKLRIHRTLTVENVLGQALKAFALTNTCVTEIQLANRKLDICLRAGAKATTLGAVFAKSTSFNRRKYAAIEVTLTRYKPRDSNRMAGVHSGVECGKDGRQTGIPRSDNSHISACAARDMAEARCIEGDVERLEDRLEPAASAYCRAYSADPICAVGHLKTIAKESLDAVVAILEDMCRLTSEAERARLKNGVELSCDQICEFLLAVAPSNGPANTTQIEIMFREKKYEEVITRCEELLEKDSTKPTHIMLQRGLAHFLLGKQEKHVVSNYLKAFLEDPSETESYIHQHQEAHLPKILELFRKCATSDPPEQAQGVQKAREQWRSLVVDCLKFVLVFKPGDTKHLQALANHLKEQGKLPDAVNVLTKALQFLSAKSNPSNKTTIIELLVLRSECHIGLQVTELAVKDLTTAVNTDKTISKSLILKNMRKTSRTAIVTTALEMAAKRVTLFKRESKSSALGGKTQENKSSFIKQAMQYYTLVLVLVPKHKQATFGCAECLCLSGNHAEAVQWYSNLLESDHDCPTLCARGMCHYHRGETARGFEDLVRAVQKFPNNVQALCGRGYANLTIQDSNRAVKDYMKAIAINLTDSVEYATDIPVSQQRKLQYLLRREGDKLLEKALRKPVTQQGERKSRQKDEASKIVETALDVAEFLKLVDHGDVNARLLKVDALRQLKRHDEAERELVEFTEQHPDNEIALVHLSTLRMKLGKSKQAVTDYLDVLRLRGPTGLATAFAEIDFGDRVAVQEEAHRYAVQLLKEGERTAQTIRDAIDCFTVSIAATGVKASKSLLARAECHAHLGNQLAAITDFTTVLNSDPDVVEALCGRACMHLTLNHRKESVSDYILALSTNFKETKNHIASLPQQPRLLVIYWLHMHAVELLSQGVSRYNVHMAAYAKLIGQLLVALDEDNSTWHSLYADTLIVEGNYSAALTHLNRVTDISPKDPTAIARCALIHTKLGNMTFAALHLGKLAEDDLRGLHFVLKVLDVEQRDDLVKHASDQAESLTNHSKHREALNFYSLAVMASDGERADLLRKRAKCLTRLEKYDRAETDLTEVLKLEKSAPLASDFCARGHVYLLHEREHRACNDYIRALDINSSVALGLITSRPGRANLARVFLGYARHTYDKRKFPEALTICDFGLRIDEKHNELKRLRTRANKQLGSGCSVQ